MSLLEQFITAIKQFGRICRSALPHLPEGSKESDRIEYQHLQCDSYVCYQQF